MRLLSSLVAVMGLVASVGLADRTWNGAIGTDFEMGGNWVEGSPPANDTATDVAIFSGAPTANQPLLTLPTRQVRGLRISATATGWNLFSSGTANELVLGTYGVVSDGSYLYSATVGPSAVLKLTGTTDIKTRGHLYIQSKITGMGDLRISGTQYDNNQRDIHFYGNNDFFGDVWVKGGGRLHLYHPNALGAKPNLKVLISWDTFAQASAAGQLWLEEEAGGFSANVREIILSNATYRTAFNQDGGTVVSNKLTSRGGIYRVQGRKIGSLIAEHRGEIELVSGFTTEFNLGYGDFWDIKGTITGGGSLVIVGGDANSAVLRIYGTNTYSGGTRIYNVRAGGGDPRVYSDTAFGSGPVTFDAYADIYGGHSSFEIYANVTMDNEFRGGTNRQNATTINIETPGGRVFTATGAFSPSYVYQGVTRGPVSTIRVENLKFGSDTDGCTFNFDYGPSSNDMIRCSTLTFGAAMNTLNVNWVDTGKPAEGTYVLFGYDSGAHPTNPPPKFVINAPFPLEGRVWVDAPQRRVKLTLFTPKGLLLRVR
ncbi:MAG: hypothetical protein N2255_07000 [Kiritimatiellae bacterium]|nr:hypothetical protein [Kiritimatiellia bacterium]